MGIIGRASVRGSGVLLTLGLVGMFLASGALVAQESVYGNNTFELGDGQPPPGFQGMGDILADPDQGGPDWASLFGADGSALDSDGNGVPDYKELYGGQWAIFEADDVSMGTALESSALTTDGRIYNGTAAPSHDLGNAYIYLTQDSAGNLLLYAAAERLGSGDSFLELEFNQEIFRLSRGGYGRGEPWQVRGERTSGDLLIQMTFSGGALSAAVASRWDDTAWLQVNALAGEGCTEDETFCAICNASTIDGGPWTNFDATGEVDEISSGHFVELGLNAGALLGAQPTFGTIRMRTPEDAAFAYFAGGN